MQGCRAGAGWKGLLARRNEPFFGNKCWLQAAEVKLYTNLLTDNLVWNIIISMQNHIRSRKRTFSSVFLRYPDTEQIKTMIWKKKSFDLKTNQGSSHVFDPAPGWELFKDWKNFWRKILLHIFVRSGILSKNRTKNVPAIHNTGVESPACVFNNYQYLCKK